MKNGFLQTSGDRMPGSAGGKSHYLWSGSSFVRLSKNARQVGYGLKKRLAGDVPAYKVVNSQGVLSGAASFEHPDLQRMLLEEEGIEISMDNKVDLKKYGWKNSLEDAEFFGKHFAGRGSSYLKFFFLLAGIRTVTSVPVREHW